MKLKDWKYHREGRTILYQGGLGSWGQNITRTSNHQPLPIPPWPPTPHTGTTYPPQNPHTATPHTSHIPQTAIPHKTRPSLTAKPENCSSFTPKNIPSLKHTSANMLEVLQIFNYRSSWLSWLAAGGLRLACGRSGDRARVKHFSPVLPLPSSSLKHLHRVRVMGHSFFFIPITTPQS